MNTGHFRNTRSARALLALSLACAGGIIPTVASAATPEGTLETRALEFSIAPQSLASALTDFAEQADLRFAYGSELTQGLQSAGVKGRMSALEALQQLLAGTGLSYRFTGAKTLTLEKVTNSSGARTLGPVRVEGMNSATAGVNGSTDPTATEGTRSYTSGALTIGSKTPRSIKDTPQSVSVITQQRMLDQNITDFSSLMNQATGVSTVTGNDSLAPTFYSRGFEVQRLQIDSGAPMDISRERQTASLVPQFDMAMYDHAEILRGADGLFNGYGIPGGVISLTRKRPLDHSQVVVEAQAGSWNNYRTVVDATAPLGFDGRLRGRGVLAYQDQDYFYDVANSAKTTVYGVLEYDLLATTLVSAGFSSSQEDAVPFMYGLPRFQSGAELKLSRDTCLCLPWNRYELDTDQVFVKLEQSIGADWKLKLDLTRTSQERAQKHGYVRNAVNPVTLTGPTMRAEMFDFESEQSVADLVLDGSFELLGHRQLLLVGANYAKSDGGGYQAYTSSINTGNPAVDVFNFNPNRPAYAEPASGPPSTRVPENASTQTGAYASLQLTFWEPLHLNLGLRYSGYKFRSVSQSLCAVAAGCLDNATGRLRAVGEPTQTLVNHTSTNDLTWPPTLSLIYDVGDTLSIYATYSDIYKEQSMYVGRSGEAVDPITGTNIEGGVKWAARDGRANATLALYRVEQENFFRFLDYGMYGSTFGVMPDGVHRCCYASDPNRTNLSQGVDLEVSGELQPGWQFAAGYTYNKNEQKGATYGASQGNPLQAQLPEHLLKLWSSYQFDGNGWLRRLDVGGGVNAQTKGYYAGRACVRYLTDASGNVVCAAGAMVPYEFTQDFYAIFSARVAYQIDTRWSAALNIDNLTDRTYYQTVGDSTFGNWYGEPRSFTLTVRGRF